MELKRINIAHFSDSRGVVFEPLDGTKLGAYKNVHVVTTNPGLVRGNHFHLKGTEVVTLHGAFLVRFIIDGQVDEFEMDAGDIVQITIPPRVAHAFKNIGTTPNLLVAFNTELHDHDNPDMSQLKVIEA